MNALTAKAQQLNTAALKEQAAIMSARDEEWATDALVALLAALETRISEAEFVAFCDAL